MMAAGIQALLAPRSLAFVGVSARGGVGAKMLKSAQAVGFAGPLWPVHPGGGTIGGLSCYTSLAALPGVPDCVVIAVPAPSVLAVAEEAATLGVRAALVVSEGFADAGNEEGRARQEALAALAEKHGMAIAGPNCMGIASLAHRWAATMADVPARLEAGGISVISQSGGLINALAESCANRSIGINYLISIGNQAVVDLAAYIDAMADDAATAVIAIVMEGIKDGGRFRAAIERAVRIKPVVVLKLGRGEKGQAATLAHTGTLAGRHEAFVALFRQCGVALVDSLDELVETAALFSLSPLPAGNGVCMLTVSGGATSLIGDLGEAAGVDFPALKAETSAALARALGVERSFANPVDSVGMPRLAKEGALQAVLDALQADAAVDLIALVLGMRKDGMASHQALADALAAAGRSTTKPLMLVSFISGSLGGHWRGYAAAHRLPLLEDLERGLRAIRHLVDYAAMRRLAAYVAAPVPVLSFALEPGALSEAASKEILAANGLPVTREKLAGTPADAGRLFAEFGGRVVLKIQSPDIPHKSDIGGVVLGLSNAAEVESAAARIFQNAATACPGARIEGVLVQEMVEDGVEFLLGMVRDEQFGPLIVCGAGGVTVEIFQDVAVALPPLNEDQARRMLHGLKAEKLLAGFRGAAPRDVDALVDCMVRFSRFAAGSAGSFHAIDLNPVLVLRHGRGVRIADALMVASGKEAKHA